MLKALQFTSRTLCLLLAAIGALVAVLAACFIGVMAIVRFQEGRLLPEDKQLLDKAVIWFFGSGAFAGVAWWLGRRVGGTADDSFRLTQTATGRSEEFAQRASLVLFFILLAAWLWPAVPGNGVAKVAVSIGWLVVAYLGLHLRIFLHELGHLSVAWLLGFHLQKIQIGDGPRVWSHRLANGLRCELRVWPRAGLVLAAPQSTRHFKISQALFVGAGPMMDAVLIWSVYCLSSRAYGGLVEAFVSGPGVLTVIVLFWFTVMSAASGLIPHRVWVGGNKMLTDGALLLQILVPRLGTARIGFASDSSQALALLQSESRQPLVGNSEAAERRKGRAASPTFEEQRARLASRILPALRISA
jgi:hypothetical protein